MNSLIAKIWNIEFNDLQSVWSKIVFYSILFFGFGYVIGEVLLGVNPGEISFTLQKCLALIGGEASSVTTYEKFQFLFPHLWLLFAVVCILIRMTIIVSSYFMSKKAIGDKAFTKHMVTYFPAFVVSLICGFALLFFLAGIAHLFGYRINGGINIFNHAFVFIKSFTDTHIPSVLKVNNYWFALILTILFASLPGYFVHWLTHRFRFFWLVLHRMHHAPQFLHPLGATPAYAFDFLLTIPGGMVAIIASKLIYTEPLVMEMILWSTVAYCFEIFNHSIVHYNFAYNNFFVRNFSRLFGGHGVYHLVHHSAFEQDQNVNLGGGPLMIWDRLFGTYRKPYETAPPVGLTNMPEMKLNPFRIVLSGVAQMAYELNMNKNWMTRLKIVFGGVYYTPPISKDFLIID
jgi:sterol desaturase/sphingolipid hydroxylase (fatty acid hydroxylase superfamily)